MRIRRSPVRALLAPGVLTLSILVRPNPLFGQDALNRVGPATVVRSVDFRFKGTETLDRDQIQQKIALTGQGSFAGLRRLFSFIPFVPKVGQHPFDPVEMQRDVVRLRNYYHRSGFPKAEADYEVRYQAKKNAVEVTYVITEGPPLLVDSLHFVGEHGPLELPPETQRSWRRFTRTEQRQANRYGEDERRALADSTVRWFRAHGYPFAAAAVTARVDSAASRAAVTVKVQPGMRARIRHVAVTGNTTVPQRELVRQLPVEKGDWFNARALEEGRQRLTQMDIVRLASVSVPRDSADDSTVAVLLHVAENPEHMVKGEAGFISAGGLTSQVQWTDRSWLGGLRTFSVAATGQSGIAALENPAQLLYRLNLTAFEPYIGDRRLSLSGGPFVEYRSDLVDRSWATGFQASLVWAPAPLRSLSLGYSISHRHVYDYGFGSDLPPEQYLPLLRLADSASVGILGQTINHNTITLEGSYGKLDRIANPRKGYVLRPRLEVTTPAFNTTEYALLDLTGTWFLPLTKRVGLTLRAGAGRLFPYGNSLETVGDESPFVSLLRLRDVTFTAGGSRDVRGWGTSLVGPKLPQVTLERNGETTDTISDRYTPVGGLARAMSSVELHFPMPFLSEEFQPYIFYDGGRVWSPDSRFRLNAGELDQDQYYHAIGFGVGYVTVVGAIQVALGYKLNPSPLDLRDPQDVLNALRSGTPIDAAPTSSSRRLHLHFSIGATF